MPYIQRFVLLILIHISKCTINIKQHHQFCLWIGKPQFHQWRKICRLFVHCFPALLSNFRRNDVCYFVNSKILKERKIQTERITRFLPNISQFRSIIALYFDYKHMCSHSIHNLKMELCIDAYYMAVCVYVCCLFVSFQVFQFIDCRNIHAMKLSMNFSNCIN